jgi:hypothetical protein
MKLTETKLTDVRGLRVSFCLLASAGSAQADTLTYERVGSSHSRFVAIIGLKTDMTDAAAEKEVILACPRHYKSGYEFRGSVEFTKADGSKWLRQEFLCLGPKGLRS